MWTEPEIASFIKRLKHVIAWTEGLAEYFDYEKGNYGKVFRKTNPVIEGQELYNFGGPYDIEMKNADDPKLYEQLVEQITTSRASFIEVDLEHLDQLGRILTFNTCASTYDGAPIAESHGFTDNGDAPPIDTWFYLKSNYKHTGYNCAQVLFCWIPKRFVPVMQSAFDVEILDSYRWLDENDAFLYERIKNNSK